MIIYLDFITSGQYKLFVFSMYVSCNLALKLHSFTSVESGSFCSEVKYFYKGMKCIIHLSLTLTSKLLVISPTMWRYIPAGATTLRLSSATFLMTQMGILELMVIT